jgi:hypothetical protein
MQVNSENSGGSRHAWFPSSWALPRHAVAALWAVLPGAGGADSSGVCSGAVAMGGFNGVDRFLARTEIVHPIARGARALAPAPRAPAAVYQGTAFSYAGRHTRRWLGRGMRMLVLVLAMATRGAPWRAVAIATIATSQPQICRACSSSPHAHKRE